MKHTLVFIFLIGTLLMSCSKESLNEGEFLAFKKCPRADLEWVLSDPVPVSANELANELTSVANCGRAIPLPDCGEGELFEDSATITLDEWCSTFDHCDCTQFPTGFTIAEQDALIAEAKALLASELTTCGTEWASYLFTIDGPVAFCDGFKVTLKASATSFCCVYDK